MPEVVFDLATKIVSDEDKVWAVFPGRGRRFTEQFVEEGAIFLETPGIGLAPGVLEDEQLLRKHVAMSLAIAGYATGGSQSPPNRRATTYDAPRNAEFSDVFGCVRNMFKRMKTGDLVIMAGGSLYSPIHAGEITQDFDPKDVTHAAPYGREDIPFRRVRWFGLREERRFLTERLSRLLSNRHAVVQVSKSQFADEVYTIAYRDFVYGNDSRYVFPGPRYNNIARSAVPGIDLLSYFIAAFHAAEERELPTFSILPIDKAIAGYFEQDILHSFQLQFSSPGSYVIHAKKAVLPLLVALLVSATSGNMSYAEAVAATIVNSANHHGDGEPDGNTCPVPILEKYKAIMDSLGAERFNALCALNKEAQDGVGLRSNVKQKRKRK